MRSPPRSRPGTRILSPTRRRGERYRELADRLTETLDYSWQLAGSNSETAAADPLRTEFYTSHEALFPLLRGGA